MVPVTLAVVVVLPWLHVHGDSGSHKNEGRGIPSSLVHGGGGISQQVLWNSRVPAVLCLAGDIETVLTAVSSIGHMGVAERGLVKCCGAARRMYVAGCAWGREGSGSRRNASPGKVAQRRLILRELLARPCAAVVDVGGWHVVRPLIGQKIGKIGLTGSKVTDISNRGPKQQRQWPLNLFLFPPLCRLAAGADRAGGGGHGGDGEGRRPKTPPAR